MKGQKDSEKKTIPSSISQVNTYERSSVSDYLMFYEACRPHTCRKLFHWYYIQKFVRMCVYLKYVTPIDLIIILPFITGLVPRTNKNYTCTLDWYHFDYQLFLISLLFLHNSTINSRLCSNFRHIFPNKNIFCNNIKL